MKLKRNSWFTEWVKLCTFGKYFDSYFRNRPTDICDLFIVTAWSAFLTVGSFVWSIWAWYYLLMFGSEPVVGVGDVALVLASVFGIFVSLALVFFASLFTVTILIRWWTDTLVPWYHRKKEKHGCDKLEWID